MLRRDLEEILLPADPVLDPVNWTYEAPQNSRVVPDPKYELANTINRFTDGSVHMVGGYVDLYRSLCSNRCRLRRNLCHVVFALEEHQTRDVSSHFSRLEAGMEDLLISMGRRSSSTISYTTSAQTHHSFLSQHGLITKSYRI
jgi:hypothetical protein